MAGGPRGGEHGLVHSLPSQGDPNHMLQKLIERRQKGREEGFTLIELMVVVLIIAILIAIAIPTFLGARGNAQDRAAQSSLRNSLTAAKSKFTDADSFNGVNAAALQASDPSFTFVDNAASTGPNSVSVSTDNANTYYLVALAKTNTCWAVRDVESPGAT